MRINLCNSRVCPRGGGGGLLLHSTPSNNNFIRPIRRGGLTAITMDTGREEDWPFLGGGDATKTTDHHHTLACAHSPLSTFDVNRWSHSLWPCTIATISPCWCYRGTAAATAAAPDEWDKAAEAAVIRATVSRQLRSLWTWTCPVQLYSILRINIIKAQIEKELEEWIVFNMQATRHSAACLDKEGMFVCLWLSPPDPVCPGIYNNNIIKIQIISWWSVRDRIENLYCCWFVN